MMRFISLPLVLLVAFTLISCSGSKSSTSSSDDDDESSYVQVDQLANYINSLPRLNVRGQNVFNTSVSSIENTTSPLFVIDGIQMGRDFGQILQVLDQNQKVSVEFLTSSRATTRYGEEGRNGVLVINKQN